MSRNTALLIKLIAYLHSRAVTERFTFGGEYSELEIREYIGAIFLGSSVESVYVLLLDDNGRVIHTEHISDGTVNASDVVPRKILESARRRNSKKIILAHNHPKGRAVASKDDIMTTGRLFNLFASVGVRLVAHYIVADGEVGVISADMLYDPDSVGKK
jgi:DNA repair protein RadC